jgi:proteasome lid subunit RPN8/RPN11
VTDIASSLLAEISAEHALAPGAEERCGLIGAAGEVIEVANIHAEPANGFHMEPICFLAAVKAGAVATWHTHPGKDPNLSEEDRVGFLAWPSLQHHILGIRDGKPTVHSFAVRSGKAVSLS